MTINLTRNAAKHVAGMLEKRGYGLGLRLGTRKSGCTGYAYVIDFADELTDQDIQFECHGVTVVVDRQSMHLLDGLKLDFGNKDPLNKTFEFHNPNVKDQCGCGESFNT